jgi:hemolysin III
MVIYGIYFKLKSKKCFTKHAVLVYLYMLIPFCFIIFNIFNALSFENLMFLSLSLSMCLFGIPFYLMKSIKFTHVVWHIFVIISNIFSNILLFNFLNGI